MENISQWKAFRLLEILSKAERKVFFQAWTGSPGAQQLLSHMLYVLGDKKLGQKDPAGLSQSEGSWRVFASEITKALEVFLAQEELKKDRFLADRLLLKRLNQAKAYHLFDPYAKAAQNRLAKSGERGPEYYQHLLQFHTEIQSRSVSSSGRGAMEPLQAAWQAHETYTWQNTLHLLTILTNQNRVTREAFVPPAWSQNLVEQIEALPLARQGALVHLFLQAYKLAQGEKTDLPALGKRIREEAPQLPRVLQQDFYFLLYNQLINKSWQDPGPETYLFLKGWLQEGFEKKLWQVEGHLPFLIFLTWLRVHFYLQDPEHIEASFSAHLQTLAPAYREQAKHFGQGFIAYAKGDYQTVLNADLYLEKQPLRSLQASYQFLLLQACYHLGDDEQLERKLRNFSQWLQRQPQASLKRLSTYQLRLNTFRKFIKQKTDQEEAAFYQELESSALPFHARTFFLKARKKR
ncbi:MAG: hypothetical protein AAFR61_29205 [Bacteroidota bacterium]